MIKNTNLLKTLTITIVNNPVKMYFDWRNSNVDSIHQHWTVAMEIEHIFTKMHIIFESICFWILKNWIRCSNGYITERGTTTHDGWRKATEALIGRWSRPSHQARTAWLVGDATRARAHAPRQTKWIWPTISFIKSRCYGYGFIFCLKNL